MDKQTMKVKILNSDFADVHVGSVLEATEEPKMGGYAVQVPNVRNMITHEEQDRTYFFRSDEVEVQPEAPEPSPAENGG